MSDTTPTPTPTSDSSTSSATTTSACPSARYSSKNGVQIFHLTFHNLETAVAISVLHLVGTFPSQQTPCLYCLELMHRVDWGNLDGKTGISIIASFLTLRVRCDDFKSFRALRQISMPRLYIVCLFALSWTFFAIGAFLPSSFPSFPS